MKRFFGLLLTLSLASAAAYAQSTMPAMGANTPKGEVARTDASINPAAAGTRTNTSPNTRTTSGKHVRKSKKIKMKSTSTM